MRLIEITDKKQLNDFVGSQDHSQFLQSWQWGEFQAKVSGRVWRLGVLNSDDKLIASAKIIAKNLPIGKKYFYCARGPIVAQGAKIKEATRLIFTEIKRLAEREGIMFLRFDPIYDLAGYDYKIEGKGSLVKTHDVQPSKTLVLDLNKSEAELLEEMHQKTRYNINLAIKKGVEIVQAEKARFEEFWRLLDQTSGRDKFRSHGRDYYQAMLGLSDNPVKLFFAQYRNQPIAAALVSFFGDTAAYLHGGSANEERQAMAPHLLQWQAVKLAKANGHKYYDFHGINENEWPGVTRFKKGFGGFEINYPGTFDLVYDQSWYNIYKMVRKLRRTF